MLVGDKIKELRRAHKMSQGELAEKAEISRISLGYYERNVRHPNVEVAKRIAIALGSSLEALFDNEAVKEAEEMAVQISQGDPSVRTKAYQAQLGWRLSSDTLYAIDHAEGRSNTFFLNEVKTIPESYLRESLLQEFESLNRRGKFEAVRRLEELVDSSRFSRELNASDDDKK
jgi:transcriptional regulator with XRE-family HTH domain